VHPGCRSPAAAELRGRPPGRAAPGQHPGSGGGRHAAKQHGPYMPACAQRLGRTQARPAAGRHRLQGFSRSRVRVRDARLDAVGLAREACGQLHERGQCILAPLRAAGLAAGEHALERGDHLALARLQRRLALQQRPAGCHQLAKLACAPRARPLTHRRRPRPPAPAVTPPPPCCKSATRAAGATPWTTGCRPQQAAAPATDAQGLAGPASARSRAACLTLGRARGRCASDELGARGRSTEPWASGPHAAARPDMPLQENAACCAPGRAPSTQAAVVASSGGGGRPGASRSARKNARAA